MNKLLMVICYDGLDAKIEEYQVRIGIAESDEEVMDLSLKLAKLIAIKNERDRNKIKPETVLKTIVDVIGMAGVLQFEQMNIITSKLWGVVSSKFFK
jgi:hypothetical protein|nr:MAG TPA: hypothetical protein [Caudoviricetes sp.]DAS77706.1 MAG TPA: hypothetical protein [Caudoviricetes sp.]